MKTFSPRLIPPRRHQRPPTTRRSLLLGSADGAADAVEAEVEQAIEIRIAQIPRRLRVIDGKARTKVGNSHPMGVAVAEGGADAGVEAVDVRAKREVRPIPLRAEISHHDSTRYPEQYFQGLKIGAD